MANTFDNDDETFVYTREEDIISPNERIDASVETPPPDDETFVYTREEDIIFPNEKIDASMETPPPYEEAARTSLNYPSNLPSSSSAAQVSQPTSAAITGNVYIWYFWDIENIPLVKRYTTIEVHNIVDAIRSLCGNCFPGAKISHMNFRVVTASETAVPSVIKDALVRKAVEFHDRPGQGKPERADKDILRLMFDTVLDNFEKKDMAFVLITDDGGYMDFLESLKKKNVIPILIHRDNVNKEIKNCVKHHIHWNQVLTTAKVSTKETNTSATGVNQSHIPLNAPSSLPLKDVGNMRNKSEINQAPRVNVLSNSPPNPNFNSSNMSSKKPYITIISLSFSVTEDMLLRWFPKAIGCNFNTNRNMRTAYVRFDHGKDAMEWWGKSLVIEGFKLTIKKPFSFDIDKHTEQPAINTFPANLPEEKKPCIVILSLSFSVTENMMMRWFPKATSCEFITQGNIRTAYVRFNHERDAMEWWGKSPVFEGFKLNIRKEDKSFSVGKSIEQPASSVFAVGSFNERSQKAYGVSEAVFQYMKKHIKQMEIIKDEGHLTLYQPTDAKKFVFEGLAPEVFKAAYKIRKLVDNLEEVIPRVHHFNEFAADLFASYHLRKLEHEWDVSLSITPSKGDSTLPYKTYEVTIVGPKDEPGVRQASAIIRNLNLLGPVVIKLDPDQLQRLETPQEEGPNQLDIISDKHTVTYDIVDTSPSREIVLYAFAAPNLASAKEAIEQTLTTKCLIPFKKGILAHVIKFHAAEIDAIRFRNNSVTIIYPWFIPLKEWQLKQIAEVPSGIASISLSGPSKKVTNVTTNFQKLIGGVNMVDEIFKYPHSRRLQARRRFESIKKSIEEEENISIYLHFRENTNTNTNDDNLDTSHKGEKSTENKRNLVLNETIRGEQFGPFMIAVAAVGTMSAAKEALAKFEGIKFDTKLIITAEDLLENGRQLQPLIKALDPPNNTESILRDYLRNEINVGFYIIPRSRPNRIELFGENEEILQTAKEKIFNFLSGISDLTGSEKVNIAEPLYGSWLKRYEWKKLHDIAIANDTSLKIFRTEDRYTELYVVGDKRNTGKARYALEKWIMEISATLKNTTWNIESRYTKIPLGLKVDIEKKYQVDIQAPDLPELFQRLVLHTGQIIELVEGNIIEQSVDCIVNAANSDLKHEGGIAKIIADAAGQELVVDTVKYLRNHRSAVPQGQAIFTKPGFLAKRGIKIVVHAVGPRWCGGDQNEDRFLFSAVKNALLVANLRDCKTIAIPPISTGIFGYPKDKAAVVLLDAVVQTLPQTRLDKVRIVDMSTGSGIDDSRSILTLLAADLERYREREITSKKKIQNDFIPLPTLAQTTFQWSWKETRGGRHWTEGEPFVPYDNDQNMQIEKAFNDWKRNGSRDGADPVSIVGDVGGVKNNSIYEVLFFQNGTHRQCRKNTGYQREIRRVELNAPSTPSINKKKEVEKEIIKESDRDYKHWKELVKFNVVGRIANVSEAVSELKEQVTASTVTYEIPKEKLKSLWQEIAQTDLKGSVTSIASRFFVDTKMDFEQKKITLIGCKDAVKDAELEIREWALRRHEELKTAYPDCWETFSDDQKWCLANVETRSSEWNRVVDRIKLTMPNVRIAKIERVQNRPLYDTFLHFKKQVADKNGGNANILSLFHGTRSTKPELIYASEQGFDPTYSSEGLWGKGCYFAYNASYSDTYAHTCSNGTRQFFLAEVIVGSTINMPVQTLSRPPQKPQTSKTTYKGETYDSVQGFTGGSYVYIIYYTGRFYPSYLITYMMDNVASPTIIHQAATSTSTSNVSTRKAAFQSPSHNHQQTSTPHVLATTARTTGSSSSWTPSPVPSVTPITLTTPAKPVTPITLTTPALPNPVALTTPATPATFTAPPKPKSKSIFSFFF